MTTREEFMKFFRTKDFHEKITVDDAIEIFRTVLHGSSDITKELLDDILSDYSVNNIEIKEI